MTVLSHKLGPGVLTIGAGPLDVSAQVTACTVEWEEAVEVTAAIPVLSGEEVPEEEAATYKSKLTVTFLQDDLGAANLVSYTWTNKGTNVAFKFIPNNSIARKVTGTLRVVPVNVGGDVKVRNTSDVSFAIIGVPVLAATP